MNLKKELISSSLCFKSKVCSKKCYIPKGLVQKNLDKKINHINYEDKSKF